MQMYCSSLLKFKPVKVSFTGKMVVIKEVPCPFYTVASVEIASNYLLEYLYDVHCFKVGELCRTLSNFTSIRFQPSWPWKQTLNRLNIQNMCGKRNWSAA